LKAGTSYTINASSLEYKLPSSMKPSIHQKQKNIGYTEKLSALPQNAVFIGMGLVLPLPNYALANVVGW
jgi:hypothetical protein